MTPLTLYPKIAEATQMTLLTLDYQIPDPGYHFIPEGVLHVYCLLMLRGRLPK